MRESGDNIIKENNGIVMAWQAWRQSIINGVNNGEKRRVAYERRKMKAAYQSESI